MSTEITVLILGLGGNVSQGILKALRLSKLQCRVVGGCIAPLALGLYTADRAYITPLANDPSFLKWLIKTCQTEKIQAVLSGVEPVLEVLAEHAAEIREKTGAVCVVSKPDHLKIGDDKLLTCQWLKEHNFNYPRYAAIENRAEVEKLAKVCGYPLIAKPRFGKGAHGIIEICNSMDLEVLYRHKNILIEEALGDADSEYTAGCFCDSNGQVRGAIVFRRELQDGTTYRAQAGEFPEVRSEAIRIASKLQPVGPCNIQMRMVHNQPVSFEINVRFSGTTPLRARLGFNEVDLALRHFVLGQPAYDLPLIKEGIALRYWNEMYVDVQAYKTLARTGRLDNPHSFKLLIEDYGRNK